jgi:hypothetical protein
MAVLMVANAANLREPDARPWVAIGLVSPALASLVLGEFNRRQELVRYALEHGIE